VNDRDLYRVNWGQVSLTPQGQELALSVLPFCVWRIARLLPRTDRGTIDSLAHLAAVKTAATHDPDKGTPTTWADYRCLGVVRAYLESNRSVQAMDEGTWGVDEIPDARVNVEADVDRRQQAGRLWALADAHLWPRDAKVLRMRHVEGLDRATVARRLGVSRNRIRQIEERAYAILRRQFAAEAPV
jgi:RNA polymerase sigma factor (sigma-70 family)